MGYGQTNQRMDGGSPRQTEKREKSENNVQKLPKFDEKYYYLHPKS